MFSRVLVDDIVEAICDEDFGLSDGNESNFEGGGDDIQRWRKVVKLGGAN